MQHTILERVGSLARQRVVRWIALPAAITLAALSLSVGQVAAPAIVPIALASTPLYASSLDKPTLTLSLSVEYPTVSAQYPGTNDYTPSTEYLGYYDADSCYVYVNDANANLRRFDRTGLATAHGCGGTNFSGNFLNWATSSAIDVLRLGLTGGDRIVDTTSMTVLQRAVLPVNFYNANYIPKTISNADAQQALPRSILGGYTGTVYIANCLNKVFFGTSAAGHCDTPGTNSNLGATPSPIGYYNGWLPGGMNHCSGEWGTCSFGGTREVWFGDGTSWRVIRATSSIPCHYSAFGDPISGVTKSCWTRPFTTEWWKAPTVAAVLTGDNFFYTRVRVCDSDSQGLTDPRKSLCTKYPAGNYKPVGNLQRYSDRMRVAAFGYLMDDTNARYGGVLRAPMKYVGPTSYDGNGVLTTNSNPRIEWDVNTGVFVANPESAAEGRSGVINYLNQFGRAGSWEGRYKALDPIAELYYESVRYLQGLPMTPQAASNLTAEMKDVFPVYTNWTDPHATGNNRRNYSCLKNNILVIGDTNTWEDKSVPGNTSRLASQEFARAANPSANLPDFSAWTRVVGAFESNTAISYVDGAGNTRTTSNPNGGNAAMWGIENRDQPPRYPDFPFNSGFYMAGIAYWANTHDIRGSQWTETAKQRPGMRISTFVLDVNEFSGSSDPADRRARALHLAAKYGGFQDLSRTGNPFLNAAGAPDNSVWQRASTGDARNYFLASNTRTVLTSLDELFATVAAQGTSIAGGAVSSQQLTTAGAVIYQAQFDPSSWSGDLKAYPVTVNASNQVSIGNEAAALWSAATRLNLIAPAARKIYIGKETPDAQGTAVEFLWNQLSTPLRTALNKPSSTAVADNLGSQRVDFLRGDRSQEGSNFRQRGSRMGDIINSSAVYQDAPTKGDGSAAHTAYFTANQNRAKAIFVGANDGMLHAFDAATGNELFGYIPSWVGTKLSLLTNPNYSGSHQSYVDGSPAVAEVELVSGSTTSVASVLVSGTGAGGQGVFALNVTDPSAFNAGKVLWEFTDRDDADLGNVVGKVQILKMRTSEPGQSPTYKWFAVVPSGVNNYVDDGRYSTTGRPALFFLDLSKPATQAWQLGTNFFKVSLPIDASRVSTMGTGVLNFKANGTTGVVETIYAGDLHGQVWKLDFTKAGTANWNVAKLSAFRVDPSTPATTEAGANPPIPMFVARDSAGLPQPISMEISTLYGPNGSTFLAFGTGKYLEEQDIVITNTTQLQSAYALYDDGSPYPDSSSPSAIVSGRGRLQAGSLSSGVITVPAFVWGRASSDADSSKRSGWYFDLPEGERLVSAFSSFGNSLFFGSAIPSNVDPTDPTCELGKGNRYSVGIATGAGTYAVSRVGVLGQPFVLRVGSPSLANSSPDSLGRWISTTTGQVVNQGSSGLEVLTTQPTKTQAIGRLSWRQIPNYHDLRAAP